jgi:eukaryotic-like serine/threonine-protein kinase
LEAGQRIRDFILEKKIGAGGVGEVWRARHQHLDRTVAIKAIYPHLSSNLQLYERFLREARALAALDHPHIVPVHDFFALNGNSYLVMAYIEGGSLQSVLQSRGRMPLREALRISGGILDALSFAHRKGIIHRDVKPSNILVQPDGHAYLVDFGIVLIWGQERITQEGVPIGTWEYMSPEQIKGKELDHRTDVYSFGCVLYEMLAGRPPFGGREEDGVTAYSIMQGHLSETPTPVRRLNSEVDKMTASVVLRALAKDPAGRFGGCQEMAEALPREPSPLPPPPPKVWLKILAALGIIVLVVVPLLLFVAHRPWEQTVSAPPALPLPALTEADIRRQLGEQTCARIDIGLAGSVVSLGGRVASDAQRAGIRAAVQRIDGVNQVTDTFQVIPQPFCEVLDVLEPLHKRGEAQGFGLRMSLNKPGELPLYVDGDDLIVDVTTPSKFASYIYVDYVVADGAVAHLFPNYLESQHNFAPTSVYTVGTRGDPQRIEWTIRPPFGLELVSVIASKAPLFQSPRYDPEDTTTYLTELRRALPTDALNADIAATFHFIRTRDRQ